MLAAVKGRIQGNVVIIDDDIQEYDGTEVIVTLLGQPKKKKENLLLIGTVLWFPVKEDAMSMST